MFLTLNWGFLGSWSGLGFRVGYFTLGCRIEGLRRRLWGVEFGV